MHALTFQAICMHVKLIIIFNYSFVCSLPGKTCHVIFDWVQNSLIIYDFMPSYRLLCSIYCSKYLGYNAMILRSGIRPYS